VPNTSATGGYLQQVAGPLEGLDLRRFIGTVLVGVSGFAPEMVRPAWQQNPPPVPNIDTNWMAFGITARRADNDPYQVEKDDGQRTLMLRHEELDIMLAFYGPDCLQKAAEVREGFELTQNTESLLLAGMAYIDLSDIIHAPELVNDRYFDRADTTLTIRREVRREYRILNFVSAYGAIHANRDITTLSRDWAV
jgi:hypothetical protein